MQISNCAFEGTSAAGDRYRFRHGICRSRDVKAAATRTRNRLTMSSVERRRDVADDFARVSGMPPAYFERSKTRYPQSDMSALRVFLALRTAARRVDNAVGSWLNRNDITLTKLDVLHLLASAEPEGMTVGQLSDFLRMTQPNVTFVMQALEREKLVKRSTDRADRRSSIFSVSKAGRARMDEVSADHLGAIGAALSVFDEAERDRIIGVLATIVENFEAVHSVPDGAREAR